MLSPQNHVSSETNKEEDGRQSSLRLTVSAWPRDATQSASVLRSYPGAQPRPTNTYVLRLGLEHREETQVAVLFLGRGVVALRNRNLFRSTKATRALALDTAI